MEGRTPGVFLRRGAPSDGEIAALQQDCFSGVGKSAICLQKCVLEKAKSNCCVEQSQFPRRLGGGGAREVVAQSGASQVNCIDKIMKVFVCTCSCCV